MMGCRSSAARTVGSAEHLKGGGNQMDFSKMLSRSWIPIHRRVIKQGVHCLQERQNTVQQSATGLSAQIALALCAYVTFVPWLI